MQRSGSKATTTASRIKTLVGHAERSAGRAEADALLAAIGLERRDLDDETARLSSRLWHHALVSFASRFGRHALSHVEAAVVDPQNLGVWTAVLREPNPGAGLAAASEQGAAPDRWHTLERGAWSWKGRLADAGEPEAASDGLFTLARAAELRALPMLFGLPPGQISVTQGDGDDLDRAAVFELKWGGPRLGGIPAAPLLGAAVLALVGVASGNPALAAGLCVAGFLLGGGWELSRRRAAAVKAQAIRIAALEREAILRDAQERHDGAPHTGSVVAGRYRLGQPLGAGASGAIYEALRVSDQKPVAIKLLRTAVAHDAVAADRLRREAEALGLAWHPNVVEVYDDGVLADGTSYLVMERLEGTTLAERLQEGPLDAAALTPIVTQACEALTAVHAAGVIHRDLKPSNIFLVKTADATTHIKLLDFGIARIEWAETRLTHMGGALGTPGYMAPEQEEGRELDGRADLFALGVIMYECLAGQRPDRPPPDWRGAMRVFIEEHEAIPQAWWRVISACVAPRADDRPATAKDLAELVKSAASARG